MQYAIHLGIESVISSILQITYNRYEKYGYCMKRMVIFQTYACTFIIYENGRKS